MSSDFPHSRHTPPIFSSAIPPYLLEGASAQERYIMENISTLNQKTDWQSVQIIEQRDLGNRVETQVNATNGRLLKVEAKVEVLQEKSKKFSNFFKNKYTWIVIGIALIFIFPAVGRLVTLKEVIKFFVG